MHDRYPKLWEYVRFLFKILILGGYYRYDEELVIPIVENTPFEEDLKVEKSLKLK